MSTIIGIDLGTSNSAMAYMEGGEPTIIENSEGSRTTPSVVAQSKKGERLIGVVAKRQGTINSDNTIYSAKRLIGRKFSEEAVQKDKELLAYEVRSGAGGATEIKMGEKWMRPAEISAMVLQKLKADAEKKLGVKITDAVITVPAYFDDAQRKATKDAGKIAGLNVKRIINEPTAAALAYGLDKKKEEKIAVFDLGGGTFDVSILEVGEDTIEVKATHGDTHLGGDDFDQRIVKWMVEEFKAQEGIDLSKDKMALQRLKESAEKAKHELSSSKSTEINQPFITTDENGPKHLVLTLSRAKLEELVDDYIDRALKVTREALADAGLKPSDIDEVVLVGGQTRMPKVVEAVKDLFNKEPHQGINPDEVVALGAAIQGGILGGDVKDVLLLDVTPLTLGIETLGGVRTTLIEKNATIPTKKSQIFSTAADNQPQVEVQVLQGEREMAADNKSLGRFVLEGIAPAPRGLPQIEVTFDIDVDGIVNVSAKDKATGKEQSIRIEGSSGISEEEVERMKKDAEEHAEEDKKKRDVIETKNQAEQLIYGTEKTIKDLGDKINKETKKAVEEKVDTLKKVKDEGDIEAIKKAIEELSATAQKIGEQLYQQQQQQQEAKGGSGDGAGSQGADQQSTETQEKSAEQEEVVEGKVKETVK